MRRRLVHDLTALADGTLRPERRGAVLRRVSASPELARALKDQLIAIEAIRRLEVTAPTELHQRIQRTIREARAERSTPVISRRRTGIARTWKR